jgi:outer membrane protein assembly factor BamB
MVSSQVQLDPVVGDGLVFVAEPDTLRAVQAGDGESAWEVPLTEPLAVRPTWDNGWLIAATRNGSILAFRARDGQPIWSRSVGSPAHAAPALAGDHVYVPTEDSRVIALRVETGAPVWERRLGGAPGDVLALEDRLYVGAKDNYFYSIKTQDGSVAWRWRTGADVVGRPIVDDDRVYFVALDNVLRALARGSGNQHWMKPLPLRPTTGPVQAGSTVLVTGLAPTVRAFNMSDGAEAGELAVAPEPAAPPYVFEDPVTSLPMVVYFTKDLASGATATLVTRTFEPPILQIAPLPNLITFGPPTTP